LRKSISIALIDQAVLSLFNLGLNLMLISLAAPSEFGRFVFASAVVLVLTSLQNALVAMPLAVLVPGRSPEQQATTSRIIVSTDIGFRCTGAIVAPILCLLTDHSVDFLAAVALVTFTTLGRETARSLALAHERTIECLRIDVVAIACSTMAIAALWWITQPAVAGLAGIAIGNGLATLTQVRTRIDRFLDFGGALRAYRTHYWRDTQWSLIGAGTTEIQYRSYVFAIELFRDAASLASVQAGRLLLGPLPLVVGAWGRVARPAMARHLASGTRQGIIGLTAQGMVFVLAVTAVYCLALYIVWEMVEARIFKGKYPDVGQMTLAWAGYTVLVVTHMVLSVPLQAAMKLKELAQVTMVTAMFSCALMVALATHIPVIYAVYALSIAELIALAWILLLVARLARAPAATAAKTTETMP
jgi:O-antigen/teichoic acid export membrane protein